MTYRISYCDGLAGALRRARKARTSLVEEYRTEPEALGRARTLLEGGEHDGILVHDSAGNVLCGVRLQLKLGLSVE
jgi:hypothetical protein